MELNKGTLLEVFNNDKSKDLDGLKTVFRNASAEEILQELDKLFQAGILQSYGTGSGTVYTLVRRSEKQKIWKR